MTGYIIWDLAAMKRFHKEEEFRERLVETTIAMANFLQEKNLTTREIINDASSIPDDFLLHTDDLTADGLIFVRDGLDRWLKSIDDIRKPVNTKSLERTYKKLFPNA